MKNYKKILSAVLALVLAVPGISIPADVQAATANLAKGKTATASAEYSTMPASYAVDGDLTTRWSSEQGAAQWLSVDLGVASEITGFKVAAEESTNTVQNIGQFLIEGSEDGSDYEEIYQSEDKSADGGFDLEYTVTLDTSVNYRYVKITIQKLNSNAYNSVSLREFEVYGNVTTADGVVATPDVNHVLSATMSHSSVETGTSFTAANAGDGDTSTRWSGISLTSVEEGKAEWLKATFANVTEIKHIKVKFHTRNIDPSPSNVSSFSIKYIDANGDLQVAKANCEVAASGEGYAAEASIVLDTAIQAQAIQLCDFGVVIGSTNYNSIGIVELEAYSNEQVAPADPIVITTPVKGDTTLRYTINPEEGYTITYNGTDYEQVIGDQDPETGDIPIYQPIVDTTVNVSFKIVEDATGDYEFEEIAVTVPGKYTQEDGDNAAPVIIPELTEWKGANGNFTISDDVKVIIASDELLAQAEAFAADYEDLTGKTMDVKVGKAEDAGDGDFYFALTTDTSLGLMDEGYLMEIGEQVTVTAETPTGAYWATRTILQALKSSGDYTTIPQGITRDYPLYEVRGLILDVGRKTFTLDYLQQMVKQMSWYKMNDFHIHLNDNYIFLEDYTSSGDDPMTAYSGFRLESDIKAGDTVELNGKEFTYQADLTNTDVFYSKADFRSFIQESDVYGVNIVPEFDAPAHSLSFTKVLPELRTGTNGRQNDHLDLTNQYDECYDFITNIFDEYLEEENPVFDTEVVHIGCDEYTANANAFRQFCNDMADYVESKNRTARIWGSLTSLKGDGSVEVDGTGIQMNLWNYGWANMDEMYELGFDLIDCNDGQYYVVPNAGYYYDYLNANVMYNDPVNSVGDVTIPAGDKQVLGGSFAVWNDMMDRKDNGISEYDIYERITQYMGLFAAKLWGKGDMTQAEALEVSTVMGDAPNTDFHYETEADDAGKIAQYTAEELKDMDAVNASVANVDYKEAVKLNGGKSYVTTGLETVGLGNDLRVKVKRTSESTEDQILFESPYGSIKAVQGETGKVGITRENYDYSFDYELPVNEWVELEIKNSYEVVSLYVNGKLVDTIGDGEQVLGRPLKATCMLPVAKIGSETNAFEGYVTDVRIGVDEEYASTMDMELAAQIAQIYLSKGNVNEELSALVEDAAEISVQFSASAEEAAQVKAAIEAILETVEYEKADYSRVETYLNLIPEDLSVFTAESAATLQRVVESLNYDLPVEMQDTVDGYEVALRKALNNLTVTEVDTEYYDNSKATATASNYQSGEGPEKAIDGNEGTMWHCTWSDNTPPHWIQIAMDSEQMINGLYYLPRSGGGNGNATAYTIEVSTDGKTFTQVTSGTWANTAAAKTATFDAVAAKYVRFTITAGQGGFGSAAEIKICLVPGEKDVETLQKLVDEVTALQSQKEQFTAETWQAVEEELAAAKDVLANDDSTVQDVEDAKASLLTAKVHLVLKAAVKEIVRIAGADRYATSFAVAEEYQKVLGVEEFDAVIVATGKKAADALSGSYLAAQKKAPILLTDKGEEASLIEYVKENLTAGGKVYLLGGTGVVSAELEADLDALGYNVKRLKGSDRYGTNLAILEEAGITGNDLLVATGEKEFDSLSASATNKPILLVNTEITEAQKEVLEGLPEGSKIWILGGTGAVSADIEAELKAYSNDVVRVKGTDRYATSVEIAKTFFGEYAGEVTMAFGEKFPDGLCGGPLAAEIGAPVLLVKANGTDYAAAYAADAASGYVFGGTGVITDETVKAVLGEEIEIVVTRYEK